MSCADMQHSSFSNVHLVSKLFFFLLLISATPLCAQTVIVTDDPSYTTGTPSAALDVKSTSKGFLAPRVTAAQRTAITSPAEGLLVYQTDGTKGFYFYSGSAWTLLSSRVWSPDGNSGTTAADFLGTADNKSLRIRTNNTQRMILDSTGNVGIGTAAPTSRLELSSGNANTSGLKFTNMTSASPVTAAAALLGLDASGNVVVGSNSASRNNHVIVKSAADFPAAVGGIRTLAAGTTYEINGTIVLTDKINMNGCYVVGQDANNDKLVYTPGSGELFTGNKGGTIKTLTLVATTTGSKLFNLDMGATENLLVRDAIIANCKDVGLVKGGYICFFSVINYSGNTNGITYQNITNLFLDNTAWFPTNFNTFEKLVGTFDVIAKLGGFSQPMSANSAVALDITGVTTINEAGNIKNGAFPGTGTKVNGTFSNKWEVEASGIATEKDDMATGNIYISSTSATVITSVNVPYKVAGTTTAANLFRVTSPANNRLVYTGTKTRRFQVIASLTASFSSLVSNKYFSFYIAKNGVVMPESKQKVKLINNTDQTSITLSCSVSTAPSDYIEVWVENNSDGTDITIQTLNLSIR